MLFLFIFQPKGSLIWLCATGIVSVWLQDRVVLFKFWQSGTLGVTQPSILNHTSALITVTVCRTNMLLSLKSVLGLQSKMVEYEAVN